jgi:hypothetical protein
MLSRTFNLLFVFSIFFCAFAFAVETIPINRLPSHGYARIQGKVTKIFNENEFLVSDESGSIVISTGTTFALVPIGEEITVTGSIFEQASIFSQYPQLRAKSIRRSSGKSISVR